MITDWTLTRAIRNNGCTLVPFERSRHQNSRGYSLFTDIAIDPKCKERDFVGVHELAHCLLEHHRKTEQEIEKLVGTPAEVAANPLRAFLKQATSEENLDHLNDLHEIEAHSVAIAVGKKLGLAFDFKEEADYLSHYGYKVERGGTNPEKHLAKQLPRLRAVFDQILAGGFVSPKRAQETLGRS